MKTTVQPLPKLTIHLALQTAESLTPLNPFTIELPALDAEWIGPRLQAAIEQCQRELQQQVDAHEAKQTGVVGRIKSWFKGTQGTP